MKRSSPGRESTTLHLDPPGLPLFIVLPAGSIALMYGALIHGYFDVFFYGSHHGNLQGIDFFAIPRAFLNLLDHRSMYDTWGGRPYGPHATWYPFHPAFTLMAGSWLALFPPWVSYWSFTVISLLLLGVSAHTLASLSDGSLFERGIIYSVFFCSFLTYWLLYVGNMHALTVLCLSFIGAGLYQLAFCSGAERSAQKKIAAGIILALLSKPVVFLVIPLLLVVRDTRKTTLYCLFAYIIITLIFLFTPALNPERVPFSQVLHAAMDPEYVVNNMNIYLNKFQLIPLMKDNSVHWFHILAQSEFFWNHVEIFSFSAFIHSLTDMNIPGIMFKLPVILPTLFSLCLIFVHDRQCRLQAGVLLYTSSIFSYFLSYNTVWEYQYTSVFPGVAIIVLLLRRSESHRILFNIMLGCSLFYALPSLYFLVKDLPVNHITMNISRSTRVMPTLIIFSLLISLAGKKIYRCIGKKKTTPSSSVSQERQYNHFNIQ